MRFELSVEPEIPVLDLAPPRMSALYEFARCHQQEYREKEPFPHIVIDNLFPNDLLEGVIRDFETSILPIRKSFYGSELKLANSDPWSFGPTARRLLCDLNSAKFCRFLEELTGIDGLISDPLFDGGGYHEVRRGGFLKIHTDFNWHKKLQLDRRLNMLVYLNPQWQPAWGGHLELWDRGMNRKVVEIAPLFNRTVIFSTSDISFHGHPDPVDCPETTCRRSIALYYYTNGRPADEVSHRKRITTNYQERPGESFLPDTAKALRVRSLFRRLFRLRAGKTGTA